MNTRSITAYFLSASGLLVSLQLDAIAHRVNLPSSPVLPLMRAGVIANSALYAEEAQMTQVPQVPPNSRQLVRQGNDFRRERQFPQAAAAYRAAIQLEPDYPPAHYYLGLILYELGDYDGASAAFNRVLELDPLEVLAYGRIIRILTRQGLIDRALATYEQAFTTVMNSGSDDPDVYVDLGRLMINREDLRERAIPVFERAIALNPNLPTAYHDLGILLQEREQLEQAIAPLQRAVELSVGNRSFALLLDGACNSLNTIYIQLNRLGEQPSACGGLSESAGAIDFVRQGRRLRGQDNLEAALAAYDQAIDRDPNLAVAHNDRGVILDELDRRDEAIAAFNRAIEIQPNVARYINLGNALLAAGRSEDALNAYLQIESVLTVLESLPENVNNQDLLSALASDSRGFEQYNDRAYFFATNQSYYGIYIDLLMQLHERYPDRGFDVRALQVSERARARSLLETLTTANIYQAIDDSQLAEQERALRGQIRDLVRQWTEMGGSVRDFVPASPPASTPTEADAAESISAAPTADSAPASPAPPDEGIAPAIAQQQAAIAQQIQTLRQQYEIIQAQIRERNPAFAQITQPPVITLEQIQQLLDNDTLLLQYWLGEEKSYLWAISKDSIETYDLGESRSTIDQATRKFYNFLTVPDQRVQVVNTARAGQELSQMILGQVANELGRKRLIIVADGALNYIPFNALPSPTPSGVQREISENNLPNPLIDNHEIVNLPSASVLAALRQRAPLRQPSRQLAVIADPVFSPNDERFLDSQDDAERTANIDNVLNGLSRLQALPGTSQEADSIIKFADEKRNYDFEVWRGFDANRQAIIDSLGNFRIIHFATHGLLNDENPERSGFLLSQIDRNGNSQGSNGLLLLEDIFQLELSADLVVLSGCRTGLGTYLRGEGLLGLTQGFMYAGAERAIVSLWSVDDDATAVLMDLFYREFVDKGRQPAQALRTAQYTLRAEYPGAEENPYYWAAFVLYGDWEDSD